MTRLFRTDADNSDFAALVQSLDTDLAERDGKEHAFYSQFNKIDAIKYAVVAYHDEQAVGCGAIKEFATGIMEIKRMYVAPAYRRKKIAGMILSELEAWATALSAEKCVLETGKRQPEAIRLYTSSGYSPIPNYGQYAGIENSLCFGKELTHTKPAVLTNP